MKRMKKTKEKAVIALNTLLFLIAASPAFADAQDPFAKLNSTASNLTSKIQMVTVVVAAAMIAICGGLYMIPSKKMRETIKSHLGSIFVGIVIVFAAGMLASYVVTWFK